MRLQNKITQIWQQICYKELGRYMTCLAFGGDPQRLKDPEHLKKAAVAFVDQVKMTLISVSDPVEFSGGLQLTLVLAESHFIINSNGSLYCNLCTCGKYATEAEMRTWLEEWFGVTMVVFPPTGQPPLKISRIRAWRVQLADSLTKASYPVAQKAGTKFREFTEKTREAA